jgi:hypothetical protein
LNGELALQRAIAAIQFGLDALDDRVRAALGCCRSAEGEGSADRPGRIRASVLYWRPVPGAGVQRSARFAQWREQRAVSHAALAPLWMTVLV